jgi:hypothetical protein
LASVLALGLAACGGNDGGNDGENATGTTTTTEPPVKGSDSIKITYQDYGYVVSGPLTSGGTIELKNAGKEFHMIHAIKLEKGKTLEDLQAVLQQAAGGEEAAASDGAPTETTGGGGDGQQDDPFAALGEDVGLPSNVMGPGAKAAVTVPGLDPGTYAIVCFIPTEGEGVPHFVKGMVSQFQVAEGPTPATPTADVTYKVSKGNAVEGPATLTAGEHTIKFEAVGEGAGDLEPGIGRLKRGATFAGLDKALADVFEGEAPPPQGAADKVPGTVIFGGGNLNEVTSYYLRVTLAAGNWFIVAEDGDDEDDPAVPKELLSIKVA